MMHDNGAVFVALLFFFDELFQTADVLAVLPDGDDGYCFVIHTIPLQLCVGQSLLTHRTKIRVGHCATVRSI